MFGPKQDIYIIPWNPAEGSRETVKAEGKGEGREMLQSRLYTGIAIMNPQQLSESAACKHPAARQGWGRNAGGSGARCLTISYG